MFKLRKPIHKLPLVMHMNSCQVGIKVLMSINQLPIYLLYSVCKIDTSLYICLLYNEIHVNRLKYVGVFFNSWKLIVCLFRYDYQIMYIKSFRIYVFMSTEARTGELPSSFGGKFSANSCILLITQILC